jgi:hypothetical protein
MKRVGAASPSLNLHDKLMVVFKELDVELSVASSFRNGFVLPKNKSIKGE